MADGTYVTLEVADGSQMRAFVARGDGAGRLPGILLFQEAFGVDAHIRDVAGRFATAGVVVVAPEFFHRTATPGFEGRYDDFPTVMTHIHALTVEGMTADITAAHARLAGESSVDDSRIAAVGYCMGGRAAYLANAAVPLAASVSYYGGGIAEGLLGRAPDLHGPQLFFWGGRDKRITPDHHRAITDALRAAGKTFVNIEFSDAEHGFFNDRRAPHHPAAARESWALVLAFLRDHVGIAPVGMHAGTQSTR
jgi:carboxymethylenebutenolidase